MCCYTLIPVHIVTITESYSFNFFAIFQKYLESVCVAGAAALSWSVAVAAPACVARGLAALENVIFTFVGFEKK